MALVERLCQIYEDDESYLNIALNPFCEAQMSILGGYITASQVKAFYAMDTEDETEYDTLIARVQAYPQAASRLLAVHRIRTILTFWEQEGLPGYTTVAEIRAQLNAI